MVKIEFDSMEEYIEYMRFHNLIFLEKDEQKLKTEATNKQWLRRNLIADALFEIWDNLDAMKTDFRKELNQLKSVEKECGDGIDESENQLKTSSTLGFIDKQKSIKRKPDNEWLPENSKLTPFVVDTVNLDKDLNITYSNNRKSNICVLNVLECLYLKEKIEYGIKNSEVSKLANVFNLHHQKMERLMLTLEKGIFNECFNEVANKFSECRFKLVDNQGIYINGQLSDLSIQNINDIIFELINSNKPFELLFGLNKAYNYSILELLCIYYNRNNPKLTTLLTGDE